MDPSVPAAQDVPTQVQSDDAVNTVPPQANTASTTQQQTITQPKQPLPPPPPPKISISGGGGIEEGATVTIEDNPDADEEDEIQVAPQEKKNLGVMGQGDAEEQDEQQVVSQQSSVDIQENAPELEPSVPEVVTSSPELEKLVEITPPDAPKLTEEVKKIGVTHSGPGIIDPGLMRLPEPKMPISIEQLLTEEEKIKSNRLHISKFWLLQKIKYLFRKVNPKIALTMKKKEVKTVASVTTLPDKTNASTEKKAA